MKRHRFDTDFPFARWTFEWRTFNREFMFSDLIVIQSVHLVSRSCRQSLTYSLTWLNRCLTTSILIKCLSLTPTTEKFKLLFRLSILGTNKFSCCAGRHQLVCYYWISQNSIDGASCQQCFILWNTYWPATNEQKKSYETRSRWLSECSKINEHITEKNQIKTTASVTREKGKEKMRAQVCLL